MVEESYSGAQLKPTKVLYLYPSLFLGPVMTIYGQIIRGLDPSRFELHVAINKDVTGALPFDQSDAIVREWNFGGGIARGDVTDRAVSALRLATALASLARFVRREQIDILHCMCTPYAGTLGLLLARMTCIPVLMHVHETVGRSAGAFKPQTFPRRHLGRLLLRQADEVVSVSRFIAKQVAEVAPPSRTIAVVENGTSLERFHPAVSGTRMRREYGIDDEDVLVLQLGRIVESKRQTDFIDAFAQARRTVPSLRGLVVGWEDPRFPGPRAELARLAAKHNLGDRFLIADARPEAAELMAAADIVVAPSLDEAWGLVVAEAMAAGSPVIGADSGGIPEVMVDGVTGFLVPPRDPAEIAQKLVRLGADADLRASMGAAGRRHAVRELHESRVAQRFAPIYERLASRAGSHHLMAGRASR